MKEELTPYGPIAQAIARLMHPHLEVIIHDLESDSIAFIYNNLSNRSVGDPSLLGEEAYPDVFPPYTKANADGREMKSISATIRDRTGKAIGLFCMNLDLSKWHEMAAFCRSFIEGMEKQPEVLFKNDWRERINLFISKYLRENNTTLKGMDREQKMQLVRALVKEGALDAKNGAAYIGDALGVSRATIYNYVREQ